MLRGWLDGTSVLYLRTDASVQLVAALEGSTYASNLSAAPGLDSDAATSARSAIIPVDNGARSGLARQASLVGLKAIRFSSICSTAAIG